MPRLDHPTRWIAVLIGGIPKLYKLGPLIVGMDRALQRTTRGRITLLWFAGLPQVYLGVAGRKSGLLRTTPLLAIHDFADPDGWLIAGTNWGGPTIPAWAANLRAAATCTAESKGQTLTMTPSELSDADREQAWAHMNRTWPNYARYATRTDRTIPVFRLTPVR